MMEDIKIFDHKDPVLRKLVKQHFGSHAHAHCLWMGHVLDAGVRASFGSLHMVPFDDGSRGGYLGIGFVDPDFRELGFHKELITMRMEISKLMNCDAVWTTAIGPVCRANFKKLGFKIRRIPGYKHQLWRYLR